MIWSNILLQQKYLSWPYIFSLQLLFVNNTLYFSISSKTFIISKCLNLFYSSCLLSETNIAVVSSSLWPLRLKCSPTGLMIVLVFFWDGGCWFFCVSHLFPQGIVHVYIPNITTDDIDAFVCATRIVAEFFKCTICNGDNKTVLDFTNFNTVH